MSNIALTIAAIKQIQQIKSKPENNHKFLRISVEGGGCSGFQYIFTLDDKNEDQDLIIHQENDNIIAKTDHVSADYLQNSTIDFIEELGSSYFKVNNPNATAKCGCGSSFSI